MHLSRSPPGLRCHIRTTETSCLWAEQLPGSWPPQQEAAIVGLSSPHPVSQSNKSPFNTYVHSICSVPLENPDQHSSFFKRPTSSLVSPKMHVGLKAVEGKPVSTFSLKKARGREVGYNLPLPFCLLTLFYFWSQGLST